MRLNIPRFLVVFVIASIAVPAVLFGVSAVFGIDLSSSSLPFIPFMGAATFEGYRQVEAHQTMPGSGDMWSAALWMGIVGMLTNLVMGGLFFLVVPGISGGLAGIPVSILVIGFTITFVVAFLISRLFLWVGARSAFKAFERAKKETNP